MKFYYNFKKRFRPIISDLKSTVTVPRSRLVKAQLLSQIEHEKFCNQLASMGFITKLFGAYAPEGISTNFQPFIT